jgi:DNA polymerase-1
MSEVAMGPQSRLLLVDGHSLAYRAFYALPVENFAAPNGQPTNAIHGFLSMFLQVVEAESPTHVAVAFDVSRDTFRRAEFPEYKANRAKSPVEFAPQVEIIREALNTFGVVNLSVEGFEADDIIATLAMAAAAQKAEVFILTGDRDSLQLVNEHITVLYPTKGVRELSRMTPDAVFEKYGVTPSQYADFAALRGDASDNLPSIPGVGEKTAATWLSTYGDLSGLLDHQADVRGKVGEALRANSSQVLLNRRLTQLVHDVPLNATIHDLHRHLGDRARILSLFDSLGLRQLKNRAIAAFVTEEKIDSVPLEIAEVSRESLEWSEGKLAEVLAQFNPSDALGMTFDVEGLATLRGIGLASAHRSVTIDVSLCSKADLKALWSVVDDSKRTIIVHGIKSLVHASHGFGISLDAIKFDTELILYLNNPGIRGLDLASSVERVLQRALPVDEELGLFGSSLGRLGDHAGAVLDMYQQIVSSTDDSVMTLHTDMELPIAKLLGEMEFTGIAVDSKRLQTLDEEFSVIIKQAEVKAHAEAGKEFNLGSPKQLQEILFEDRKLPKTKKIKTGYTTDAESLQGLLENTGDAVVEQILQWREMTKLRQTVAGLIPLIDGSGRIHTTFSQTVAATGRLSSADPNLQNIPVRTESGRKIRACFVADKSFDGLMTADYSQIEMRIMAHLSNDEGLIAAFNSGEDLHTTVASQVFSVDQDAVTPDMRRRIKAMSYGLAYGLSSFGLSQQLGIEPREAAALMDSYFGRFGGVNKYLKDVVAKAASDGYTETMFGRRRLLPELTSTNQQLRAQAERMALNAPIQGSAADLMKLAMLGVARGIQDAGLKSRLLLQVHDELVLEIAPGESEPLEEVVRTEMGKAADLLVPLDVTVGIGPDWNQAAH